MLSVCLCNLWILVNLLAGTGTRENFKGLKVTAKKFCVGMCYLISADVEEQDRPPD